MARREFWLVRLRGSEVWHATTRTDEHPDAFACRPSRAAYETPCYRRSVEGWKELLRMRLCKNCRRLLHEEKRT